MEPLLMAGFECDELSEVLSRLGYQLFHTKNKDYKTLPVNCHLCLVDLRCESFMAEANYLVRELNSCVHVIVLINKPQLDSDEITTFIAQFAWDYCTSPIHPERLEKCLGHGMGLARLKRQCVPSLDNPSNHQRTCESQVMQVLFHQVERVAPTDIPVLIRGESGTGKELIAKKLHALSSRSKGPFIAVNCGAMAAGLVQSELFGHEKGAFTGAAHAHKGKITQAHGGSLFLDEIGDLPLELQVNLLRFLQEGMFDTVGGSGGKSADVRIIAATHVDLEQAIDDGEFRLDLFYRLNGITLETPPLRERRDDILPLAEEFISTYLSEYELPNKQLSADAKQAVLNYSWPGNVRELINRIRRAVVLSDGGQINASNLELTQKQDSAQNVMSLRRLKDDVEKQAIQSAILVAGGQAEQVASQLKISRATLYRLMDKHGLQL
ncbi:sigma-54 dependent transcriptional regulator [Shewanella sp. SR44-3]|uniref:sigma-54 dependent transcriptional regulator n=1 Tax=unclassified Shewanella TaxID=196818 RepID=UPI0015FA8304|nr:sigma-54 dependent transcriptional regulator [Shewanella sp. SR44-3]MBB1268891.1 sigma-54-dependent Fis family transcriptional regulator [Shewanella sp. SR44-3]